MTAPERIWAAPSDGSLTFGVWDGAEGRYSDGVEFIRADLAAAETTRAVQAAYEDAAKACEILLPENGARPPRTEADALVDAARRECAAAIRAAEVAGDPPA